MFLFDLTHRPVSMEGIKNFKKLGIRIGDDRLSLLIKKGDLNARK